MKLTLEEKRKRKYNETHKTIDNIIYKLCSKCDEWLYMEDKFYKNKSAPDGHNPYCKSCTKNKSTKWRQENPEKYKFVRDNYRSKPESKLKNKIRTERWRNKGKQLQWQRENPDKVKEYNHERYSNKKHDITDNEWENCKNYFNYRCAYCDLKIEEHFITYRGRVRLGDFHKDHADDEGANDLSNCIPSCKSCNVSKYYYKLSEWYNENNQNYTYDRNRKIHMWLEHDYKSYIKNK